MLARIPAKLLFEWMEYASLNPFGQERQDMRIAMLTAFVGNALSSKTRFKPEHFMLCDMFEREVKPQSPKHMEVILKSYAVNLRGKGTKGK